MTYEHLDRAQHPEPLGAADRGPDPDATTGPRAPLAPAPLARRPGAPPDPPRGLAAGAPPPPPSVPPFPDGPLPAIVGWPPDRGDDDPGGPTLAPIDPVGLDRLGHDPGAMLDLLRALLRRNARLEEDRRRLAEQALTDPLTGLGNRRWLFDRLDDLWADALRRRSACWVMMADLDHFKAVNDAHGHDAGDAVLAAVGGALRDAIRRSDVAARFGGEEFCLAGPGGLKTAALLADRILSAIRSCVVAPGGLALTVTASLGVAVACPSPDGPGPWASLRAADAALYRAKAAGRDRAAIDAAPS